MGEFGEPDAIRRVSVVIGPLTKHFKPFYIPVLLLCTLGVCIVLLLLIPFPVSRFLPQETTVSPTKETPREAAPVIPHYPGKFKIKPPGFITSVAGGLGNQLFRFACAYTVSKRMAIPMYISLLPGQRSYNLKETKDKNARPYLLEQFNIPTHEFQYVDMHAWDKNDTLDIFDDDLLFNAVPGHYKTKLLRHIRHCQNEAYFYQEAGNIKKFFTPIRNPDEVNPVAKEWLGKIREEPQSVCVHIRRGDYSEYKGWTTPLSYYRAAMASMNLNLDTKTNPPKFFVFSDTMEFAQEFLFNTTVEGEPSYYTNETDPQGYATFTKLMGEFKTKVKPGDVEWITGDLSSLDEFYLTRNPWSLK